ncbi:hypothetical protein PG996_008502 [Apiospora saccharicola]|uniref:Uncharacterized protein n=1 Tax=Apiospora saccharicola TaxID=335842 RepID=A0ABR1UY64_9PEZI
MALKVRLVWSNNTISTALGSASDGFFENFIIRKILLMLTSNLGRAVRGFVTIAASARAMASSAKSGDAGISGSAGQQMHSRIRMLAPTWILTIPLWCAPQPTDQQHSIIPIPKLESTSHLDNSTTKKMSLESITNNVEAAILLEEGNVNPHTSELYYDEYKKPLKSRR